MSTLFTPVSILAPDKPLALSSLGGNTNKTDWVMNGETELLLCAYCVSHDQKWLLATFSDRSGELLSTAVIGIHPAKYVVSVLCTPTYFHYTWHLLSGTVLCSISISVLTVQSVSSLVDSLLWRSCGCTASHWYQRQCSSGPSSSPDLVSQAAEK